MDGIKRVDESENLDAPISKTQLKQAAADLVDLGKAIAALSSSQFDAMPLDANLRAALADVRKMHKGPAIKRQFKFIGKLLREVDADILRQALDRQLEQDRSATARLHHLERWRDRLIEEGDAALGEYLDEYPEADRQNLRQLIRQAQKEQTDGKPPASARKLFKCLREFIE